MTAHPTATSLAGRVVLVVGAGSSATGWSNGRCAAIAYARAGAHVVAIDRSPEALEVTARSLVEEGHAHTLAIADVTVPATLKAVADSTLASFDRIDVLHYNVGLATFGSLVDTSEDTWEQVMRTNVTGAFHACRSVLPVMADRRAGVITAISSLSAERVSRQPTLAYNVSKAALEHLIRSIAVLHASDGVRANIVQPGLIDSPANRSLVGSTGFYASEEERQRVRNASVPIGRMGEPWDVAESAVFLATDAAKYISGATLTVDGAVRCQLN
jgi:NAD(P)-dependent dehydrogenase (short-subunit alcohol dehydrogenase family)